MARLERDASEFIGEGGPSCGLALLSKKHMVTGKHRKNAVTIGKSAFNVIKMQQKT